MTGNELHLTLSGEVVGEILAFRNFVSREAGMRATWNGVINRLLLLYRENQLLHIQLKNRESKIHEMHESMHLKVEHFLELALTHPNSTSSHVSMQQSTGILVPPPSIPPPPPISAQSNSAVKTQPLSALSSPIVNVKNNSISLTLSHTTPPTEQTKTDIVKELNTYIGTLGENEVLLPSKVFAKSLLTLKSAQSNPI